MDRDDAVGRDRTRACTLGDRQLARYDDVLGRYAAAFGASTVAHIPIRDHSFVAPSTFADEMLPVLRATDDAAEPIVVHCWAGLGRTGHLLALWLVTDRGYELTDAVEAVRSMNRRPLEAARGDEGDGHAALRAVLDAVGDR
ncbi:MAG: dual specificity protein phosphatase family protein [Haloplanus sp.]